MRLSVRFLVLIVLYFEKIINSKLFAIAFGRGRGTVREEIFLKRKEIVVKDITMDHNHGDGDDGEGCPMIMTFHVGNCEAILFKKFTVKTVEEFASAVVVIFLIAIAYEGLKFWREKLYSDYAAETSTVCSSIKASTSELTSSHNKQRINKRSICQLLTHKIHLAQTLLHFVQITVSYCLMLIVMTFNVWLVLAVILGAAVGYFFFGWIRQRSMDMVEHCH